MQKNNYALASSHVMAAVPVVCKWILRAHIFTMEKHKLSKSGDRVAQIIGDSAAITVYWSEGASTESYSYLLLYSYAVVRQQTSLLLSPPFSHRVHCVCGGGGFVEVSPAPHSVRSRLLCRWSATSSARSRTVPAPW